MCAQSLTPTADRAIAALAARQHGAAARWQLLAAGVSGHQIKLRIKNGRLHEIHRGVYFVGHKIPTEHARDMAALLALRDNAVLSHRSAASLWDLLPYPASAPACVTVPPERSARRPRITIHRVRLDERDIRRCNGMQLTSPPRTILDLAGELNHQRGPDRLSELESLVANAQYRRLASETELRAQVERNPGCRGVGELRRVLGLPGGPRRTRSPAERAMLRLLRSAGINGYEVNGRVHGYEVDFLWRDLNLVGRSGWLRRALRPGCVRARPKEGRHAHRERVARDAGDRTTNQRGQPGRRRTATPRWGAWLTKQCVIGAHMCAQSHILRAQG